MSNNAISYLGKCLRRLKGESEYNWEGSTWRLKCYSVVMFYYLRGAVATVKFEVLFFTHLYIQTIEKLV